MNENVYFGLYLTYECPNNKQLCRTTTTTTTTTTTSTIIIIASKAL